MTQDQLWNEIVGGIVDDAHLSAPDELMSLVRAGLARAGLTAQLYLSDLPQRELNPVPPAEDTRSLSVDSTVAGRVYQAGEIAVSGTAIWLPVVNGTERLGVLRVGTTGGIDPHDTALRQHCWTVAGLLGHLVMAKTPYGDLFHKVRRVRPFTVQAELLWTLLPPQTFSCPRLTVSAVLEPHDRVGGDAYDYAVDGDHAILAVFDGTGHDLRSGLATTLALAATRAARRTGRDLWTAVEMADDAILEAADGAFVTAVLAELDLATGTLDYLVAGHPPPALVRAGQIVKLLTGPHRPPLGYGHLRPVPPHPPHWRAPSRETLEPGDRLLFYSDGITEARDDAGRPFGLDRLVEFTERHHAAGLPAPETLRRLAHAIQDHQHGPLADDATLILAEWRPVKPARDIPGR